jgi:CSLREA domain-containing protein
MRRLRFVSVAFVVAAASAGIAEVSAPTVHAAPAVTVNSINDTAPAGCATTGTGSCTLREAVIFANHNTGTTITLPAGIYVLSRTGTDGGNADRGDLDIRADTTIVGAGPATTFVRGAGSVSDRDRVFDVYTSGTASTVSISGVTVENGFASDGFGGGGIWEGSGVDLTLTNTVVQHSATSDGKGGGIVSVGSTTHLTLVNTTVSENSVVLDTVNNMSGTGGGVYTSAGVVMIDNSAIINNSATGSPSGAPNSGVQGGSAQGGGLMIDGTGSVTIVNSLVASNRAVGQGGFPGPGLEATGGSALGGGIYGSFAGATVTLINSTVTANEAKGGSGAGENGLGGFAEGGGIKTFGRTTLINDTITRNRATGGPAGTALPGSGQGGGLYLNTSASRLTNTIVAENKITSSTPTTGFDVTGNMSSGGHNLIGVREDGSTWGGSDLTGSSVSPLDPKLALALAANGGSTNTVALLTGSPAINAGDSAVCALPLPPVVGPNGAGNIDQRGISRPQPVGGQCDIGAFEYVFAPSTTTVTSSANPAAVGQAITYTASVSGSGTPTGAVIISDGATSLGGGTLAGGVVTVTTAALSASTHSITASYSGDTVFAPSTSASLTQVVGSGGGGGGGASGGLQFFPLAQPVRLLDTRPGESAVVHPGAALVGDQPISLPGHFTSGAVTIPAEAQALVGNATVDNTIGVPAGFATLWPSGSTLPLASNLNFVPGTTRPNAFTVGLGGDGNFNLLSNTGGNFIIDITGYYAPPTPGGLYFHPLTRPVRLLDTRLGASAVVHPDAALTAGQTLSLPGQFASGGATVPVSAKALAGNATVDNTANAPAGFATLFPGGTALPPTSNLNYVAGTVAPNEFTVGLDADGSFNLYSNSGGDFIVDVTGYYDTLAAGGLLFHSLAQPVRQLDTRIGASASVHSGAPLAPGGTLSLPGSFDFSGASVPFTATALVGNATVDNTINAAAGFATLYPGGTSLPLASNLNYSPGLVAPNAFIVGVGSDGTYNLFSQSGSNFIIDISGYLSAS